MIAYAGCCVIGFLLGSILIGIDILAPGAVFEISTKRISFALPVLDSGAAVGINSGLLLFAWNSLGALASVSFLYTAAWFNPRQTDLFPKIIRRFFCLKKQMRLLCYLPGCRQFEAEALRRVYVWLMVPLLGMMLLGIENGLSISTARFTFGSYYIGMIALLPHGIVEIPAFTLAGAVAFSAQLCVKQNIETKNIDALFSEVETYRNDLPIMKIIVAVIFGLLVSGLIEAHITLPLVFKLLM